MYVLTNGIEYIYYDPTTNGMKRTTDKEVAAKFKKLDNAKEVLKTATGKTKGCYVADMETGEMVFKRPGKPQRKTFSRSVRQLIYAHAKGRCALCGKKIKYCDMDLDHIVPLAMGGADDVANLQCTCVTCNRIKGSILPEEFDERITEILLYRMKQKAKGRYFLMRLCLAGRKL